MSDVLPHNLEAEENVLGAMMLSPVAIQEIEEIMRPEAFYRETHAIIYQAARDTWDRGDHVDPVTLADELDKRGKLERVGGTAKIAELAALVPAAGNAAHHARIVMEHHTRRELIRVGQDIARSGWEPQGEISEALDHAETSVYDLTTQQETGELRHVSHTLAETFRQLDRPGGEVTGTPTGLIDLDRTTAGLQPGNLVVVAARPGQGKSALALQTALHIAVDRDQAAAIFTLEMSAQEINQRALSAISHVNLMKIRRRNGLTMTERAALNDAGDKLEHSALYVDDTVAARTQDIRARARRLKSRRPDLALVVVDYLQLMIPDRSGRESREQEVASISRGLKLLARELELPVMALAQLNRNVEHRGVDAKPMLADLRDSGAIEQDADLVVFIHRPKTDNEHNEAELIIAKHRNGPTASEKVTWIPTRAVFANHTEAA